MILVFLIESGEQGFIARARHDAANRGNQLHPVVLFSLLQHLFQIGNRSWIVAVHDDAMDKSGMRLQDLLSLVRCCVHSAITLAG